MLKKGDKVVIFEDPMTREKPEGNARLVLFMSRDTFMLKGELHNLEDWMVRFPPERHQYQRRIDPENPHPW